MISNILMLLGIGLSIYFACLLIWGINNRNYTNCNPYNKYMEVYVRSYSGEESCHLCKNIYIRDTFLYIVEPYGNIEFFNLHCNYIRIENHIEENKK